jgi:hypothetical protein
MAEELNTLIERLQSAVMLAMDPITPPQTRREAYEVRVIPVLSMCNGSVFLPHRTAPGPYVLLPHRTASDRYGAMREDTLSNRN